MNQPFPKEPDTINLFGRPYEVQAAPFDPVFDFGLESNILGWHLPCNLSIFRGRLAVDSIAHKSLPEPRFVCSFSGRIFLTSGIIKSLRPKGIGYMSRYTSLHAFENCIELLVEDGKINRILNRSAAIKRRRDMSLLPIRRFSFEWTVFNEEVASFDDLDGDVPVKAAILSDDRYQRIDAALRDDWTPSSGDLENGLADPDAGVRIAWSWRAQRLDKTIDQTHAAVLGLNDELAEIRREWARNSRFQASREDSIRGLNDVDLEIRLQWIEREDAKFTPDEFAAGLLDASPDIRAAWAFRLDFPVVRDQILKGLADPSAKVRSAWAYRNDWTLDESDRKGVAEVIAEEHHEGVLCAWFERDDWQVPAHAIPNWLKSLSKYPLQLLLSRRDWTPSKDQVRQGLEDNRYATIWIIHGNFTPDPSDIARGLAHENESVRRAWAERLDWSPTPQQIDAGIADTSYFVRASWAKRTDFHLSEEQWKTCLADEEPEIAKLWLERLSGNPL